jgi:hypothetical protein
MGNEGWIIPVQAGGTISSTASAVVAAWNASAEMPKLGQLTVFTGDTGAGAVLKQQYDLLMPFPGSYAAGPPVLNGVGQCATSADGQRLLFDVDFTQAILNYTPGPACAMENLYRGSQPR